MLHALIMAGGAGTRFWPESRSGRPKQLLNVLGNRTMIQATIDRLTGLVPPDRVLVVTNARLAEEIARQLPELPRQSILGEPCKRDTAPCIGLAAFAISRLDPDATMVVLPADHAIANSLQFQAAIRSGAEFVDAQPERIVTYGIPPTYPAESFGYIERGEPLETLETGHQKSISLSAYRVKRFREKPKLETAQQYLSSGSFYWNSGIFVWKAGTILQALQRHQPDMFRHLQSIAQAWGTELFQQVFEREFEAIRGISIDFAVMEHATDVIVIEAPFSWDDVGSWQAVARLVGKDGEGNTVLAKHLGLRTRDTIVRGPQDHLIVTLGISDCIVVHTPDATLVANKNDEESIRQLVKMMEERGWTEYL